MTPAPGMECFPILTFVFFICDFFPSNGALSHDADFVADGNLRAPADILPRGLCKQGTAVFRFPQGTYGAALILKNRTGGERRVGQLRRPGKRAQSIPAAKTSSSASSRKVPAQTSSRFSGGSPFRRAARASTFNSAPASTSRAFSQARSATVPLVVVVMICCVYAAVFERRISNVESVDPCRRAVRRRAAHRARRVLQIAAPLQWCLRDKFPPPRLSSAVYYIIESETRAQHVERSRKCACRCRSRCGERYSNSPG